jgi:hypothetical protein
MYCPKIPVVKSWIPEQKRMIQIVDAHPPTESPHTILRMIIKTINVSAVINSRIPNTEDMASGFDENAIIPSSE